MAQDDDVLSQSVIPVQRCVTSLSVPVEFAADVVPDVATTLASLT